jgi:hypothetical protein
MARHEAHTVQYFPFVVKDGKTLFLLEDKYKCKGTGFFTNVLRILCDTPDHHLCIDNEVEKRMFFVKVKCDEESALDMLEMMVLTKKLDPILWRERHVIYCDDLVQNLADAYRRRKNDIITKEYIYGIYGVNDGRNVVNDGRNGENGGGSTQSKVKYSKVKYSNNNFDVFYNAYPRHVGKEQALKTWNKLTKNNKLPEVKVLIDFIETWKTSKNFPKDKEYIPHPSTWLNGERWNDEIDTDTATNEKPKKCKNCGRLFIDKKQCPICGGILE